MFLLFKCLEQNMLNAQKICVNKYSPDVHYKTKLTVTRQSTNAKKNRGKFRKKLYTASITRMTGTKIDTAVTNELRSLDKDFRSVCFFFLTHNTGV